MWKCSPDAVVEHYWKLNLDRYLSAMYAGCFHILIIHLHAATLAE